MKPWQKRMLMLKRFKKWREARASRQICPCCGQIINQSA